MRKIIALILALCLFVSLASCGTADVAQSPPPSPSELAPNPAPETPPEADGGPRDIVILFTSDVHGALGSGWTFTGVDVIRRRLLAEGHYVFLVDNGDAVQGDTLATMTSGGAVIEMMNALGYDAAAIGNHEFDYGMDRFFELAEMADFPYISCNFNKDGELLFDPYVIREAGDVKIAFVGISTPWTLRSSTPKYFMDESGEFIYGFMQGDDGQQLYDAVQKAVDEARAAGADFVVAMAHLGSEAELAPYTYADVIENTTGIDVLLDGHSHDLEQAEVKNKDGKPVPRAACGTKLQAVGYARISPEGGITTGLYRWENQENAVEVLGLESPLNAAYRKATEALTAALAEVVARSEVDLLTKDPATGTRLVRNQETNIGDLCADAYRYVSGADIAFVNGGGVRADILKGDVTREDILSVHPFGNMLSVCEATGREVLDALEFGARAWPNESGGWLCPSGVSYEIHTYIDSHVVTDETGMFLEVEGEYRVKNIFVGGEPLDLNKTYIVAAPNYTLQNMGDGYTMFADNVFTQDSVMLDVQVLMTYITEGLGGVIGAAYAEPQGRVVFVTEPR